MREVWRGPGAAGAATDTKRSPGQLVWYELARIPDSK